MSITKQDLLNGLDQFYGSDTVYYLPLFPKYKYTEGVRFLAQNVGGYWLLEYIFSNQHDASIKAEEFQVWKIIVRNDNSAVIRVEDGNKNLVKSFDLVFTDFPLKEYSLWFVGGTLLLPSEY